MFDTPFEEMLLSPDEISDSFTTSTGVAPWTWSQGSSDIPAIRFGSSTSITTPPMLPLTGQPCPPRSDGPYRTDLACLQWTAPSFTPYMSGQQPEVASVAPNTYTLAASVPPTPGASVPPHFDAPAARQRHCEGPAQFAQGDVANSDMGKLLIFMLDEFDRRSETRVQRMFDEYERRLELRAELREQHLFSRMCDVMNSGASRLERKFTLAVPLTTGLTHPVADVMSTAAARRMIAFMLVHGMCTDRGIVCILPDGEDIVICTTLLAKYLRASGARGEEATKRWVVAVLKRLGATFATENANRADRVDSVARLSTAFGLSRSRGTRNNLSRMDDFLRFTQSYYISLASVVRQHDPELKSGLHLEVNSINFSAAPFYAWGVHGARNDTPIAGRPWWAEVVVPHFPAMSTFAARVRFAVASVHTPESEGPCLFGQSGQISRVAVETFAAVKLVQPSQPRKRARAS